VADSGKELLDGIVFTSQNAVTAFARCLADLRGHVTGKDFDERLRKIPAFVVGEATEKLVTFYLFFTKNFLSLFLSVSLFGLSVCVSLSSGLSLSLSVYLFLCVCLSLSLSIYLSIFHFPGPSICLAHFLSPSVFQSLSLSLSLSLFQY
jgi:hypothetical protein